MSLSQKQIAVRFLELAAAGEVDEAYSNSLRLISSITILIMRVMRLL